MHVSLIRAGGYLDFGQPTTEQDWDNWQYVARNSRKEHDRQCQPRLAELRVASGGVKRRRRHSSPARAGEDDAPRTWMKRGTSVALISLIPATQKNGQVNLQQGNAVDETSEHDGVEEKCIFDVRPMQTNNDTLYSEFVRDQCWPSYGFSGPHARTQLSAFEQIQNHSTRLA